MQLYVCVCACVRVCVCVRVRVRVRACVCVGGWVWVSAHMHVWACLCNAYVCVIKMVIFSAELNTGIVLWFQQFYGLLIKRFLHSLRNWRAIITQLIMPVIFIVIGLALVYTVPGTSSVDPKRPLSLRNSAIDDEDIRTFYAEFGNGNPIFQVRQICIWLSRDGSLFMIFQLTIIDMRFLFLV